MLRNTKDIEKYAIGATDGNVGQVKDFYFDDHAWVIRYLVVDTGSWLLSRKVLISPISIRNPDWAAQTLPVAITKEQVRSSPAIDTDRPVSRQHEMQYLGYYGYSPYWGGAGLWGAGMYPYGMYPGGAGFGLDGAGREQVNDEYARAERARHKDEDPNLRSCHAVTGYHIHATDGEIFHVQSMLIDDATWAIRYIVVDTSNWWLGHQVLIDPQWIKDVSWAEQRVSVDLSRASVKDAPPYDSANELDRKWESDLYYHYKRPQYWTDVPRTPEAAHRGSQRA